MGVAGRCRQGRQEIYLGTIWVKLIEMSCNSHRHSGLTLGSGQDNSVLGGEKCVQGVTMCGRGIGFHSCACVCVCPLPQAVARHAAGTLTRAHASISRLHDMPGPLKFKTVTV